MNKINDKIYHHCKFNLVCCLLLWITAFPVFRVVFIQLRSKSGDPVFHYMFPKPLFLHLLFNSIVRGSSRDLFWFMYKRSSQKSQERRAAVLITGCVVTGSVSQGCSMLWGAACSCWAHVGCVLSTSEAITLHCLGFFKQLGRALTSLQDLLAV